LILGHRGGVGRNRTCMIGSLLSCRITRFRLIRVGTCLSAISLVSKFSDEGERRKMVHKKLEMAGNWGKKVGEEKEEEGKGGEGDIR